MKTELSWFPIYSLMTNQTNMEMFAFSSSCMIFIFTSFYKFLKKRCPVVLKSQMPLKKEKLMANVLVSQTR